MTQYARAPRARVDHIVRGTATRCGLALTNMATWPASLSSRTEIRPTCDKCRSASTNPTPPET